MNINTTLARDLGITAKQVETVIALIDEGNTIPFISRYRKDVTGGLNDEILRTFDERLRYLRNLEDRKATIVASIESQGKMTEELMARIEATDTATQLEDLYRPYKPKRRTRATIAMEKGLGPLAEFIMANSDRAAVLTEAASYIDESKEILTSDTAIQYALDIIAGDISDRAEIREWIRAYFGKEGSIVVGKTSGVSEEERSVYENYFDFRERVSKIPGHRILAINRGENEDVLSVHIEVDEEQIVQHLLGQLECRDNELMEAAVRDSYKRLIAPSIENEVRKELTEKAEDGAIKIFSKNLEQLLMQPPIMGKTVLGWDPAFRTGCKLAVVDSTGKILDTTVIFPTAPQFKINEAKAVLAKLCKKYDVDIISVGNGTASRESEQVIAEFIKEFKQKYGKSISYVIVNEAGASVYSASKLATEEYPDLDVGERSSASIARRLQDPLAELVKIDPRSIGVGQYQHDMNQKKLSESLGIVVEDCVNKVGVDLNTASPSLLEYVSGISKTIAGNIVKYREANGRFNTRRDLLKVPKLGPKAYEQCAGFLRIQGGKEPLDMTSVHPENYEAAKLLIKKLGYSEADIKAGGIKGIRKEIQSADLEAEREKELLSKLAGMNTKKRADKKSGKNASGSLSPAASRAGSVVSGATGPTAGYLAKLAGEIGVGTYALNDIIDELEKPGRDPRTEAAAPILRSDIMDMKDLREGMELRGTVRNIVDFGAFVDIGVHQDGLVHISELSNKFVKHPLDVVSVGDIVDVKVLSVDQKRGKISLTMKK